MNISRLRQLSGSVLSRCLIVPLVALSACVAGTSTGGAPTSVDAGSSASAGMVNGAGGTAPSAGGNSSGGGAVVPSAGTAGASGGTPMVPSPYAESVLCPAPMTAPTSALSPGFAVSCAGCHGDQGEGKTSQTGGVFPSLQDASKKLSLADFTEVVRHGRPSTLMPAFIETAVPADQIKRDYDALRGGTVTASADPDCGPGALQLPSQSAADIEATIATGMVAFRKRGEKGACAGCHSAAGFDMAAIGFSDAAILRRAVDANHLSAEDGQAIVELIHALRVKYGVERPLHPMKFRFLQPGGEPLQPAPQDKFDAFNYGLQSPALDRAFALSLRDTTRLLLVTDTIDSLDKAKAAQDQVLKLNYQRVPIGITLEHWTEDAFHGPEHNTPVEWIPMMTRNPAPGHEAEWLAKVDAYRADPSDANLWNMFDAVDALTVGDHPEKVYESATTWSRNKYLSVQVASHMLLHRTLTPPDQLAGITPPADAKARRDIVIAHNPFWVAGDAVRLAPLDADGVLPQMVFPPSVDLTINKGPPAQGTPDVDRLMMTRSDMLSWFWLGFMNDPALLNQEDALPTVDTDYFNSILVDQGYNMHSAFAVNVAMIQKANAPAEFMTMRAQATEGTGIWASPRPFLVFKQNERDLHFLNPGDKRTPIHAALWANTFRTAFYLMNDELSRTNKVFDRTRTLLNVNFMYHWFKNDALEKGTDHTALFALVDELRNRLKSAQEIGQVTIYASGDATDPVTLCLGDDLDLSVPACKSWGSL